MILLCSVASNPTRNFKLKFGSLKKSFLLYISLDVICENQNLSDFFDSIEFVFFITLFVNKHVHVIQHQKRTHPHLLHWTHFGLFHNFFLAVFHSFAYFYPSTYYFVLLFVHTIPVYLPPQSPSLLSLKFLAFSSNACGGCKGTTVWPTYKPNYEGTKYL
jgi:hypothetical protein